MALPIDPGKIKKIADTIVKDIDVDIAINIYYDSYTNPKILNSFKEFLKDVDDSVIIDYIDFDKNHTYNEMDSDFAIILDSDPLACVLTYKSYSAKKIPCAILDIDPATILNMASDKSISINKSDLLCPSISSYKTSIENNQEVIDFETYNSKMDKSLKKKFRDWLCYVSQDVQVAYAAKLPFLRNPISKHIINATSLENAGVGALRIVPGIDIALLTLNQARMLLQLAAIYGYEIGSARILEIVVLALSSIGLRYISRNIKEKSSVPNFIIDAGFGLLATQVVGCVAKEYFSRKLAPESILEKVKLSF